MSTLDRRWARFRPVWSIVVAGLLAISLGPWLRGTPAEAVTTYTRSWSCPGFGFLPMNSLTPYSLGGPTGVLRTGSGQLQCPADIPNRAVVTRVRFTLRDATDQYRISDCRFLGVSLAASDHGAIIVLAGVQETGLAAKPGDVRYSTTSITHATIDRSNHAYFLYCSVGGQDTDLGIWGADVTYTITAANR